MHNLLQKAVCLKQAGWHEEWDGGRRGEGRYRRVWVSPDGSMRLPAPEAFKQLASVPLNPYGMHRGWRGGDKTKVRQRVAGGIQAFAALCQVMVRGGVTGPYAEQASRAKGAKGQGHGRRGRVDMPGLRAHPRNE